MNDQLLQQDSQGFLDPDNRETLLKFLKEKSRDISEEAVDIVNRMAPLRVMEKVLGDSSLSPEAQVFFRKIEATNNGAKPGESFEDFLWRYIESDDVSAISEDELDGLAEVYQKISGIQSKQKDNTDLESEQKKEKVEEQTGVGIKLQVKPHPEDVAQNDVAKEDEKGLEKAEIAEDAKEKKAGSSLKEAIKSSQIDLVRELEIDQLPKEEQEKSLLQMGDIIQQRILLRVVEEFPENKKDELLKLTENKDASPDEFNKFVEENLPNIEEIVSDEVEKYKREALDFTKEVVGG